MICPDSIYKWAKWEKKLTFDFGYFLDPKPIFNDQVGSTPCHDHKNLGVARGEGSTGQDTSRKSEIKAKVCQILHFKINF